MLKWTHYPGLHNLQSNLARDVRPKRRLKEMAGKLALHLKAKDEEQKTAVRIYPVNSTGKTAGEDRPQMLR